MLNISKVKTRDRIDESQLSALNQLAESKPKYNPGSVLRYGLIVFLFSIFLPWTQSVQTRGVVTTLRPEQRSQKIPALVPGIIQEWLVKDGDFVHKGDTLVLLAEGDSKFFDPAIVENLDDQISSEDLGLEAYKSKIGAISSQMKEMTNVTLRKLDKLSQKQSQTNFKLSTDSAGWKAKATLLDVALKQNTRYDSLYVLGMISLKDLENRQQKLQKAKAAYTDATNKLLIAKAELTGLELEMQEVRSSLNASLAKAESDQFSAKYNMNKSRSSLAKLKREKGNLDERKRFHVVVAPQDGQVMTIMKAGQGEAVKGGEHLLSMMPSKFDLAVEMYVEPIDVTLLQTGQEVRIQFDGWPAVVFSGWPNSSYGTFDGSIFAIDPFISSNGKYRVMVKPKEDEKEWPAKLRVGAATKSFILLNDVMVGYEAWRQINGFPADFYVKKESQLKNLDK